MFTWILVWQPGETTGKFVLEPGKLGNDHGEIREVAWLNSGEICVRAWKVVIFTWRLVWQPGSLAAMFVFEPGKVVYVHG